MLNTQTNGYGFGIRLRSPAGRAVLFLTLLCWLWLTVVTPFGHTCSPKAGNGGAAMTTPAAPCLSCEWLAYTTAMDVAHPTPPALVPGARPTVAVLPTSPALSSPVLRVSPRAPPA